MRKAVLIGLPFLALGMLFLLKLVFPFILAHLYSCKFKEDTGYWCPGCGNTRFAIYLLRGDILTAIKCNYGTDIVIVAIILFYIEQLLKCFGINKKLLPRKTAFWVTVLVIVMIYYILRNFIPILDIPKLC